MPAQSFRRKPVVIEVIRWMGDNIAELQDWAKDYAGNPAFFCEDGEAEVWNEVHEDWFPVPRGALVAKGPAPGDYYPIAYATLMDGEQYEPC